MTLPAIVTETRHHITYVSDHRVIDGWVEHRHDGQILGYAPGSDRRRFTIVDDAVCWVENRLYVAAMCDADNPDRDLDENELVTWLQEVA